MSKTNDHGECIIETPRIRENGKVMPMRWLDTVAYCFPRYRVSRTQESGVCKSIEGIRYVPENFIVVRDCRLRRSTRYTWYMQAIRQYGMTPDLIEDCSDRSQFQGASTDKVYRWVMLLVGTIQRVQCQCQCLVAWSRLPQISTESAWRRTLGALTRLVRVLVVHTSIFPCIGA